MKMDGSLWQGLQRKGPQTLWVSEMVGRGVYWLELGGSRRHCHGRSLGWAPVNGDTQTPTACNSCPQEEAERKAREEQAQREHEEYLKLKEAFVVEEEGVGENMTEEQVGPGPKALLGAPVYPQWSRPSPAPRPHFPFVHDTSSASGEGLPLKTSQDFRGLWWAGRHRYQGPFEHIP